MRLDHIITQGDVRAIRRARETAVVGKAEVLPLNSQPSTLNSSVTPALARILRPQAAYRWLLPSLASITPQYIEAILRSALTGNHVQQWELFDLMFDTWPELGACAQELTYGVSRLKMIFEPFAEEDEDPTPSAIERSKLVSSALRRMAPDPAADENDLEGTLKDIIDGWFRGVLVLETDWQTVTSAVHGTILAPRATFWVHPQCFAWDRDGRLGLRVNAQGRLGGSGFADPSQGGQGVIGAFPPHKFLIGIHKAKSGSALGGALLRPLAWWWCAANFSADWLLNLAQVFGLPFRWANYDPTAPQETVDRICSMLQNMGSAGWAAFPAGTTMELKEAGDGGDHSPQGELLDRADRYARLLLLGQTQSGGKGSSVGGQAFGTVESDVKADRIDAAGRYACRVLNTQLIPSILTLNYGDADECPKVRLLEDEEGDLNEAQRDTTLAQGGLKIGVNFLRKKYGLPKPAEGEETIGGAEEPEGGSRKGAKTQREKGGSVKAGNSNHDARGEFTFAADKGGGFGGGEIRETRIAVHPALERKLGLEPGKVFADCAALAKKHPEYFADSQEAKAYVDHVMAHPTHVLPGNVPDHRMVVRHDDEHPAENPAVALEIELRGGKYRVRSAHTWSEEQFQKNLKAAGPGATLGVSRVDPPLQAKTPSRSLDVSRGTPPVAVATILSRMRTVNRLAEVAAITDDALFAKALAELAATL